MDDWTDATIEALNQTEGGELERVRYPGLISDNLGMFHDRDAEDDSRLIKSPVWRLVHLPSGLTVASISTREACEKLAAALRERFGLSLIDHLASTAVPVPTDHVVANQINEMIIEHINLANGTRWFRFGLPHREDGPAIEFPKPELLLRSE